MTTPEETYQAAQAALDAIYQAALDTGDLGMIQQALSRLLGETSGEGTETPVHAATKKGHVDAIRILIKAGADPNVKDTLGRTPLHYAILELEGLPRVGQRVDILNVLLDAGADPNAKDGTGITPFHKAVQLTTPDIVKLLMENGADLGVRDNNGWTALHWASNTENDAEVIKLLLASGADLSTAGTCWKQAPLHIACEYGRSTVVSYILACDDIDLEAKAFWGGTPLHFAAEQDHLSIVELLLDKGANLEAKDNSSATPLHYASKNRSFDVVVKALIERRENIFARGSNAETPLDHAIHHNHTDITNYLLHCYRETVSKQEGSLCLHSVLHRARFVIGAKAVLPIGTLRMDQLVTFLEQFVAEFSSCIRAKDTSGELALHVACRTAGPVQVIRILVELYPDSVRSRDSKRATPLHVACRSQDPTIEVVRFLVEQDRAVIFQIDSNGCTPLHAACKSAPGSLRWEKIKFLIETGGAGTLTARDDEHWALPLHLLCASKPRVKEVEHIVGKYPKALYKKTKLGDVPLMVACEHAASLSAVYALMRALPGALINK